MAKIRLRDPLDVSDHYYYQWLYSNGYRAEAKAAVTYNKLKETYTHIKGMIDDHARSKRLYEQQRDQIGHPPMAREPLDNYTGVTML